MVIPGTQQFGILTDIFLPWIAAAVSNPLNPYGVLDNTMLERRNELRLNSFLREIRYATLDLGGTWRAVTGHRAVGLVFDREGFIVLDPLSWEPTLTSKP
ncbi:hypothetical protein ACWDOP_07535 [Nocardia sp. NPDC003693]